MPDKRDIGGDAFWSVDDLTPPMGKKRNKPYVNTPTQNIPRKNQQSNKVNSTNGTPFSYSTSVHPTRGGLISSIEKKGMLVEQVRVSSWPTPYSFFEQFRRDAVRFFNTSFGEAEFEPFFSFMPQYFQLNGKQLRYYFWWRENIRRGTLLKSDYSYVLLYIYEILNLPDLVPPAEGAKMIAMIWAGCRRDYPRLDRYLCEWLADYCLIHAVALPTQYLLPFYGEILHKTTLKEFYIDALDTENEGGKRAYYRAIFEMSTNYRFRQSRAITPTNEALFEKHIPAAVTELIGYLMAGDTASTKSEVKRISRDSYAGAVCTYHEKRMLDLVIHSLALHCDLSGIVTDATRYSENCLRQALKMRAGYQTTRLTDEMKAVIDNYFAKYLPSAKVTKRVEERMYDEKYDGKKGFSDTEALAIEEASRAVANRLGAVYTEETEMHLPIKESKTESQSSVPLQELRVVLQGGYKALVALADNKGVLPETLVEKINAYTTDLYGDILLMASEDGYTVIEDYIEELPDVQEEG